MSWPFPYLHVVSVLLGKRDKIPIPTRYTTNEMMPTSCTFSHFSGNSVSDGSYDAWWGAVLIGCVGCTLP